MPGEQRYYYDEPIGLYGPQSHECLARGLFQDLVRYEESHQAVFALEDLPDFDVPVPPADDLRISSLVESADARLGYALVMALPQAAERPAMGGLFYSVDRSDPGVLGFTELEVKHPALFLKGNQDYRQTIEKLKDQFDKSELEILMRLVGKMTTSLEAANRLQRADEDFPENASVAAQMKHSAKVKHDMDILRRSAGVEPFVLSALHNRWLMTERAGTPGFTMPDPHEEPRPTLEHIAEWTEFMTAADGILDREVDPEQPLACVNMQYEQAGRSYYVKLAAEHGQLFGVQFLCDVTGSWQTGLFNLRETGTEDEGDQNLVSPIWNKAEVLACLREGEVIDDESYEYYRKLAERSIQNDQFSKPVESDLLYFQRPNEKRSVA